MLDAVAARVDDDVFADEVFEALETYWRGDADALGTRSELAVQGAGQIVIDASKALLY